MLSLAIQFIMGLLTKWLGALIVKKEEESGYKKDAQSWANRVDNDDDFAKRLRDLKSRDGS